MMKIETTHPDAVLAVNRANAFVPTNRAESPVATDSAPARSAGTRLAGLDFVKGTLVLVMVLYHWINYFIGLQWGGYRYLRFLTPAFIFITGYLISQVYLQKYSLADLRLHRRLAGRGLKLLVLFIVCNLLIDWTLGGRLFFGASGSAAALAAAKAIFVFGNGRAAFDILVSIAYFVMVVPLVLLGSHRLHISLALVAAGAVAWAALADVTGHSNGHFELISMGLIGLAAGAIPITRLEPILRSPTLLGLAYAGYLIAITWWNALFVLQILGVCLTLLVFYAMSAVWGTDGLIQRIIIRLGQYSLLSYMIQIVILQLLRIALYPIDGLTILIPFVLTIVLTILAVETTIWLRRRSVAVDGVYRAIFA